MIVNLFMYYSANCFSYIVILNICDISFILLLIPRQSTHKTYTHISDTNFMYAYNNKLMLFRLIEGMEHFILICSIAIFIIIKDKSVLSD